MPNSCKGLHAATALLFLAACTNSSSDEPDEDLIAELAEIEDVCGLPAGSLRGEAVLPETNERPQKIACVMAETQKRNLKIGFISNPVDPNAQTH
jgi:hypothetical protein